MLTLKSFTIQSLLEQSVHSHADNPSISFVGKPPLTYAKLDEKIEALQKELILSGIGKQDKVAILGENSPQWVIAYLAVTMMGAVSVPILPGFPESDIHHIIRDAHVKGIFISQKQRPFIDEIRQSPLQLVLFLDDLSIFQVKSNSNDPLSKFLKKPISHDLKKKQMKIPVPEPKDLAAIIYTSGTTGNSKGVMLTHENIVSDVINAIQRFPIVPADRFLSILPLSHTFESTGGMLCPLSVGAQIVYMQGLPTPQKLLESMMASHPTSVLTVPLVMDKIYRKRILPQIQSSPILSKIYAIPSLRKVLHKAAGRKLIKSLGGHLRFFMFGGAALHEDVEIFLRDAGIKYSTGYGMTETSPILTINPIEKVKLGSCGKPIPEIEIKIHEPDPETGIGEIIVKGPNVMQGYYKNPEATKNTFLNPEWLRTGDLGYFDDEGYLFIKGRSKNVLVGPSGENIYPENIEHLLCKYPIVQEVIVYQDKGTLVAKVYPNYDYADEMLMGKGQTPGNKNANIASMLEDVRLDVNTKLIAFSRLARIIEHTDPFEKTPTNKVKRYLYIPES